ncbi:hypothetical protein, partial [Burkholderia vietnamiensis]|uniref:hypothetical protein n=1 Tax=Burkholderia vietnamiensis TaxID=60552 RepID=UPI001E4DC0CC
ENLLGFLFMAPFSQELEPPQNSVRFNLIRPGAQSYPETHARTFTDGPLQPTPDIALGTTWSAAVVVQRSFCASNQSTSRRS